MTTEAVVINKIGIALATDSAVTISGSGKTKVFDTGDKLFELDLQHPVAIMINGNMDYLGVPWELIIKDFRERENPERKDTLQETLVQFLDFTTSHKASGADSELRYIRGLGAEECEAIKQKVSRRIFKEDKEPDGDAGDYLATLIVDEANRRREYFNRVKKADSLSGLTAKHLLATYSVELGKLIRQLFAPVELSRARALVVKRMIVSALLSSRASSFSTGIIIAGYAPGDLFPSLAIAEIDSSVAGRLKYSVGEGLTVDRTENPGRVISFAQTDVADRILSGADHKFMRKTADFIKESLEKSKDSVVKALEKVGVSGDGASSVFDTVIRATTSEFKTTFWKDAREDFQKDFNEMVALMPKQDIIELAEAIVSITAIERKASSEQATVGGPVDVAFVTRHEGFVWIRRKHYFEKDLNPRYFRRRFSEQKPGEAA
ncbi:MAG TPA: hypothetical protein VGF77_10590 [Allosphingosinicella sp.]